MRKSYSHHLPSDQAVNVNVYRIGMGKLPEYQSLFRNCGGGRGGIPTGERNSEKLLIYEGGDRRRSHG